MRFVSPSLAPPPAPGLAQAATLAPRRGLIDALRRIAIPFLALAAFLVAADLAEAKRVGGGKSFGSRDSYSRSYDKPAAPDRGAANLNQQAAPGKPGSPVPGAPASRPGGFGGLGGMLGGMLMGGLIGSMLFGGTGGGFGILELLLLGGVAFLLFRMFRARRTTPAGQAASPAGERFAYASGPSPASQGGGDGWGALRAAPAGAAQTQRPGIGLTDFDEAEFLAGAKALFARLQASWDRRDLDDIRRFATPEVFAEIARQAEEEPTPSVTDVLMVEARVLEADSRDGRTVITLLFDALLREDPSAPAPNQVREVWRISRDDRAGSPEWTLEGIQQLAM